jgi:hypothetical protein
MFSIILVGALLYVTFAYLREQRVRERRVAAHRDLPREQLFPRRYKSAIDQFGERRAACVIQRSWLWAASERPSPFMFSPYSRLLSYTGCSHACHVRSPANNAAVPSVDSGLEK